MPIGEPWMKWTVAEAVTRSISKNFQKIIGVVSESVAHTFYATAVIGFVQTVVGFVMARKRNKAILADKTSIFGSILFGVFAVIGTVLSFMVFLYGGDMGVNTFIVTLSIIPGAFIDRFWFGNQLMRRQWLGVCVAIFAGYAVLGFPSSQDALKLPLWIWLSVLTMLQVAINQGITQKISAIDPFVKNFWGGITTSVLGAVGMLLLNTPSQIALYPAKLVFSSLVIGGVVVFLWTFNLLSYKGGAYISLKKLIMNGVFLTLSMISGTVFFGESFTIAKGAGVLFYIAAFVLVDKPTWKFVSEQFLARRDKTTEA